MAERVYEFNKRFKKRKLTLAVLRRLYREEKIHFNKMSQTKITLPQHVEKRKIQFQQLRNSIYDATQNNFDLVFVDEVMFTKHTFADRTWSKAGKAVKYDMRDVNMKPIACVVAVSERYGLDLLMMWPKSVTNDRFHTFIKRLRSKYPFRRMNLYMDNLSIHRSKATQKVM